MEQHPALPLTKETLTLLTEKWAKLHPCIWKIKLFSGRDFDHALTFVAKAFTPLAEFLELSEWANSVYEDGALHDIAANHRREGKQFSESQWKFFTDKEDDLPNQFLGSDSYWALYPNLGFVNPGEIREASAEEQRVLMEAHFSEFLPTVFFEKAQSWAKIKYPAAPISRIVLYKFGQDGTRREIRRKNIRYALVFEIDADEQEVNARMPKEYSSQWDSLLHDIGYLSTMQECPSIFANEFGTVYRNGAKENFFRNWEIVPKFRNMRMPIGVLTERSHVVLYPLLSHDKDHIAKLDTETSDQYFSVPKISREKKGQVATDCIGRFENKNDIWEITYESRTISCRNSKGISDIAMLLSSPNALIDPIILEFGVSNTPQPRGENIKNVVEYDASDSPDMQGEDIYGELTMRTTSDLSSSEATLDSEELETLRCQIQAVYNRTVFSEDETAEREYQQIKEICETEYDVAIFVKKNGEVRLMPRWKLPGEAEKARQSIQKRIKRVYDNIEKRHDFPQLASFLRNHIVTGNDCIYKIDPALPHEWEIIW